MPRCIVLDPADNVATLIDAGRAGEECTLQGERQGKVALLQDAAFGHKVCIAEVTRGGEILGYGQVIGRATRSITVGEHAHVHNLDSARARGDLALGQGDPMDKTFPGDRCPDGRAGVRNRIAVISVMDNRNPVTRAISRQTPEAVRPGGFL